jgi:chromosome segregation ATPase
LDRLRAELKRNNKEMARLEAEVSELRELLEANEQADINQILESVEGNETLEYIRQLESEQIALRSTLKDVSSQLQNSKVANSALARQFQTYKTQMKKRPTSGKVISIKS